MMIAVSGARGFIGGALCALLRADGHTVLPLPRELGRLPAVDAVVHLAGESVAGCWTARKRAAIFDSRVEGTRRLVRRLADLDRPPRVLVSASAIGYYGDRPGEVLDEASPPGTGFRAGVCRAWEAEARRATRLGVRSVQLRFGHVLHPSGGLLGFQLPFLRRGLCFRFGAPADPLPWIGLEDAARLIRFALFRESLHGPVNATAPVTATQDGYARLSAALAGRRVLGRFPPALLRLLIGEQAGTLTDRADVRPVRALDAGFTFRHPSLDDWRSSA